MTTTIYTKPGCPYCAAAKQDLEARGVDYDEIDVYLTPGAREQLAELTGGMNVVPVIVEENGEVRVARPEAAEASDGRACRALCVLLLDRQTRLLPRHEAAVDVGHVGEAHARRAASPAAGCGARSGRSPGGRRRGRARSGPS